MAVNSPNFLVAMTIEFEFKGAFLSGLASPSCLPGGQAHLLGNTSRHCDGSHTSGFSDTYYTGWQWQEVTNSKIKWLRKWQDKWLLSIWVSDSTSDYCLSGWVTTQAITFTLGEWQHKWLLSFWVSDNTNNYCHSEWVTAQVITVTVCFWNPHLQYAAYAYLHIRT